MFAEIRTAISLNPHRMEVNAFQAVAWSGGGSSLGRRFGGRGARRPGGDVDYVAPRGTVRYLAGAERNLPSIDAAHGVIPGVGDHKYRSGSQI